MTFSCKLCGCGRHGRAFPLGGHRRYEAAACAECGLFQVLYDWTAASPLRVTTVFDQASEEWTSEVEMAAHGDKARTFASWLEKQGWLSGATVLDIGCGHGHFLQECARRGARRVVGLEFRQSSITYARERCGVSEIRSRPLDDRSAWPDGEFDLAVSLDVLEHVHDLASVLGHCLRVLRPGGVMFHATPGSDSITHQTGRVASRLGARGIASMLCNVEYVADLLGGPHVHLMGRRQVAWFARRQGLEFKAWYVPSYTYSDRHYAACLPQFRWLPLPLGTLLFRLGRMSVRNKMVFWVRRASMSSRKVEVPEPRVPARPMLTGAGPERPATPGPVPASSRDRPLPITAR